MRVFVYVCVGHSSKWMNRNDLVFFKAALLLDWVRLEYVVYETSQKP